MDEDIFRGVIDVLRKETMILPALTVDTQTAPLSEGGSDQRRAAPSAKVLSQQVDGQEEADSEEQSLLQHLRRIHDPAGLQLLRKIRQRNKT